MFIIKNEDGSSNSFNFNAPAGAVEQKNEVLFPFSEKLTPAFAAVLAVTIKQMDTFLQPAELTGDVTINLTIDAQVTPGAKIHIKLDADDQGDKTVTLGDGFDADAADLVVESNKVRFISFMYDGAAFVPVSSEEYLSALIAALDARVAALEAV